MEAARPLRRGRPKTNSRKSTYRRLNHANSCYGRSTPLPGWRTDRGRIYIILGPPRNIEQYDAVNGVYPTEIWFYLGDPDLGLPTAFNVIFFKRDGGGDYVLYSPTEHGPRSLIAGSMGGFRDVTRTSSAMTNDQAAYKELKELEPNLAQQVLSLIPGESVQPGYESLASNRLMATIFNAPQKKIEVDYADAILKYKDFVEVEYTANYVGSEVQVQVIRDATGESLVHYTIEPARISAEEAGGRYDLRFRLTGRVSDAAGKTVYQFDKDFPFSLSPAELEDVRAKSISIQDVFPLVPGSYSFDILLKNVLSKEFMGAGRTIVVPDPAGPPGLSPLLLAYGTETKAAETRERVPFKVGDAQLLCQTRKMFGTKDSLVLFVQPYEPDRRPQGFRHSPLRIPEGGRGTPDPDEPAGRCPRRGDRRRPVPGEFPPGLLPGPGDSRRRAGEGHRRGQGEFRGLAGPLGPAAPGHGQGLRRDGRGGRAPEHRAAAREQRRPRRGPAEAGRGPRPSAAEARCRRGLRPGPVPVGRFRPGEGGPPAFRGSGERAGRGPGPAGHDLPGPGRVRGSREALHGLSRPLRHQRRRPQLARHMPQQPRERRGSPQSLDEVARGQPGPAPDQGPRRRAQEEIAIRAAGAEARRYGRKRSRGL
ncbi:MAG: GWxTD domain-containing protein [Candidatus Moduliflexus flocculans]|nr:GWxTD domain-containing protein [Candidatus Moduliflexus flocculans]